VSWVVLQVVGDDLADHGVLAQQDYSVATQSHADVSHLLGSHVVALHNHDLGVGVKQLLQPGEVPCLTLSRQRHAVAARAAHTQKRSKVNFCETQVQSVNIRATYFGSVRWKNELYGVKLFNHSTQGEGR
jgi:hypothetical protein